MIPLHAPPQGQARNPFGPSEFLVSWQSNGQNQTDLKGERIRGGDLTTSGGCDTTPWVGGQYWAVSGQYTGHWVVKGGGGHVSHRVIFGQCS